MAILLLETLHFLKVACGTFRSVPVRKQRLRDTFPAATHSGSSQLAFVRTNGQARGSGSEVKGQEHVTLRNSRPNPQSFEHGPQASVSYRASPNKNSHEVVFPMLELQALPTFDRASGPATLNGSAIQEPIATVTPELCCGGVSAQIASLRTCSRRMNDIPPRRAASPHSTSCPP